MKISELIKILQKLDQDKEITVARDNGCGCFSDGYADGYDEKTPDIIDLGDSYSIRND